MKIFLLISIIFCSTHYVLADKSVNIQGFAFSQNALTLTLGEKITFTN